jgi:hypothetical protein
MKFLVFALLLVFSTKNYSSPIQDCLNAAYQYQAKGKDINPEIWCQDVTSAEEESCREAGLAAKLRGEIENVNVKASCKGYSKPAQKGYSKPVQDCLNAAYQYQANGQEINPREWCDDVASAAEESCLEAGLAAKLRGEIYSVNVKELCKGK